jgi:hypothetical protein
MLDGLDQIDWASLGHHVYGKHEEIPANIRALLSEDETVREEARNFLLGGGQDSGDIYETTPHIIPFLIELLTYNQTPDKFGLLFHLAETLENIRYARQPSLHQMRLNLQTYEAFQIRLNILLGLLAEADPATRFACVYLLENMTDDTERVIPALMEHFKQELDEEVQLKLLDSLKILLHSIEWRQYTLLKGYAPFFREIVETHESRAVRVKAARASIELLDPLGYGEDRLASIVPNILADEFLRLGNGLDERFEKEYILRDLVRLKPEPMFYLLRQPGISADDAHLIARGLLVHSMLFPTMHEAHWLHYPNYQLKDKGNIYLERHSALGAMQFPRVPKVKEALQALVENNKVWEVPTNMFSFFFGLPDSREELRALLDSGYS